MKDNTVSPTTTPNLESLRLEDSILLPEVPENGIMSKMASNVTFYEGMTEDEEDAIWESRRLGTGHHQRQLSFSLPEDMQAVNRHATDLFKSLAQRVVTTYQSRKDDLQNGQLFIAVAGGPGSGKSTLCEKVAQRVNARLEPGIAVVLPMDGFHYSRESLRKMAETEACVYTYEQLLQRRGAPWTFDHDLCAEKFKQARHHGEGSFPVYSREKSDPVPDGVQLMMTHKIVFLEGNYLLAWDDPNWSSLQGVFDEAWYVACTTLEEQRERLINRHLSNWTEEKIQMWGEGHIGAGRKADSNDVLNSAWIDHHSRKHADLIVESK
ncbi:predicted protein [Phaeodactylum tricornutum CCAP 1055/1]|jgi:pantothenate kinase|uniref:Phosphoribulokinase/uridine kinase domain-containing protein n=1 Tax=Phaeodactylum tricornutum (strain CCAP 1055/1) TaxID=556484 RepID=B7S4D8_PHATC|nr:predicted protein [Phaeodactylum tricornutum CCAP 1055/1]EEC42669.1 predicted protein [Phaeodactylum tricornutum CCAP 1055/1]|eukprot:XP_002176433.1 predicted protein [Phaeodactylum tricornutum CCAP 1055/1]